MKQPDRPDGSKPIRLAHDLYWAVHRVALAEDFHDVQAYIHVVLQAHVDAHPKTQEARAATRWHAPKCPCPPCRAQRRRA
jgi:hypothetical protein